MPRALSILLPVLLLLGLLAQLSPASAQLQDLLPQLPRTDDAPANPQPGPPPPPNAPQEEQTVPDEAAEWFVSPAGKALGPYTISELRQMATEGKIDGHTPVWKEGMAQWALLNTVPELRQVVDASPQTDQSNVPPPPQNSQALLDEQIKNYLIGTWRFEDDVNQGGVRYYLTIEITYRKDGSYAGWESIQLPGYGGVIPPPVTNPRSGTFQITALDETNFVLSLNERGSPGKQASLRIVDRNTVEDANDSRLRSYRVR